MLPSLSELIADGFELYREHFKLMLGFALLLFLPTAAVFALGLLSLPMAAASSAFDQISNWLILIVLAGGVAFAVITLGGLLYAALRLSAGEAAPTLKAALALGYSRAWPLGWAIILVVLALGLGALLLIIPGVIFAVWYVFVGLMVVEGKGGIAALQASQRLVVGQWWHIFWRAAIPFAVSLMAILILATLILYLIGVLASPTMIPVFDHLVITAVTALVTPWWLLTLGLLYRAAHLAPTNN